jgi:hypothetical protein
MKIKTILILSLIPFLLFTACGCPDDEYIMLEENRILILSEGDSLIYKSVEGDSIEIYVVDSVYDYYDIYEWRDHCDTKTYYHSKNYLFTGPEPEKLSKIKIEVREDPRIIWKGNNMNGTCAIYSIISDSLKIEDSFYSLDLLIVNSESCYITGKLVFSFQVGLCSFNYNGNEFRLLEIK